MADRDHRVVTDVPESWVIELDELAETAGKSRADILRDAIREYLDHDRAARIEADIADLKAEVADLQQAVSDETTHTHKHDTVTKASETVEKTREIADRLRSNYEHSCRTNELERCIKDIAGGDRRTVQKYKSELKDRSLAFEHPNDSTPVWFTDRQQWRDAAKRHASNTLDPKQTLKELCDDYGDITPSDVADLAAEVAADD